jgi:hypothetical protein
VFRRCSGALEGWPRGRPDNWQMLEVPTLLRGHRSSSGRRRSATGPSNGPRLSYRLCYRSVMAPREKRSISLPADLAAEVARAAEAVGTTVSGWLAETAARRLKIEAGLRGVAEWEAVHGPLTDEERAEGEAWARRVLGREGVPGSERESA